MSFRHTITAKQYYEATIHWIFCDCWKWIPIPSNKICSNCFDCLLVAVPISEIL